ncbi:alginate lyase family protein [Clostridium sp. CF012]|uniref:alginate lyase family protein n=1 Tax=Clostridium sp. CF012 TaxID=2843319 RepID=UPI001C0D0E3F|nr:alginate lyase family protein [Clostridium sp. CF012]MBU3142595.1 heparinase II/III family protein [Clostridium sp. CF012]
MFYIKSCIGKVRKMGFQALINKVFAKVKHKIYFSLRAYYLKIFGVDIDENYFKDFAPRCNFLFDVSQIDMYVDELIKLDKSEEIIKDGEKICSHVFNLLGSGDIYLGERLPWNKDFKTGFIWKNKFYKNIRIIDLNNNSDVKIPWELSRFQHFFTLGKAYLLTTNEKYSLEFKEEIEDWIKSNPVEMSVNWACTMDVAIRAVNWIIGYFFFKDSVSISKEFLVNYNKNLYLHGRYIIKNLENQGEHTGNHYLSNIVGLIWLGIYFGEFVVEDNTYENNPRLWLGYAAVELEKEMFIQVNEDGTNYEASTSYHRLVTELFLLTTVLCNKNTISFSGVYMSRLEKMCEFIMDITKPNNLSPLIGDTDDGRLAIVSNYSSWLRRDFGHILAIAGECFNREDFRYYGRHYKEDALWIVGSFKENVPVPEKLKSKAYKDGGFYILRNDRIYCLIRCGQLSFRGQGCHSHNDQLSFELNVDGEDFIVDPGVYVYTADYKMRNLFRSTEMHNTLYVVGYEQNNYEKYDLFNMEEQTFAECVEFCGNIFVGRHLGYRSKCGVIHQRTIDISDNYMRVIDEVIDESNGKANNENNLTANFILDSEVVALIKDDGVELVKNNIRITLATENEKKIKPSYLSWSYGDIKETRKIEIYNKL